MAALRLPSTVDLLAAATLPLNALTAAQALVLAQLHPGQTLLVTDAAGAVVGAPWTWPPGPDCT